MQSDTLHTRYGLRIKRVLEQAQELKTLREGLTADRESLTQEIADLSTQFDKLAKVGVLFRSLMDLLVVKHVRSIEGVVTEGLRTIITDQSLNFEAEVSQSNNKVAIDFYISQDNGVRLPIRAKPLEAFGGGASSIASLILRVLTIRRLHKWPLLVLDETLGAVSEEYVERTGAFLQQLAQKTRIPIFLVTHTPAFLEHASVGYRASQIVNEDGSLHVELKKDPR